MNRDTSQITVNDQIGRFESSLPHLIALVTRSSYGLVIGNGVENTGSNPV